MKPYLISRGSSLSFAMVFLGVLGGVLAFGLIGLFLGPVLLAVGLILLKNWTHPAPPAGRADLARVQAALRCAPSHSTNARTGERASASVGRDQVVGVGQRHAQVERRDQPLGVQLRFGQLRRGGDYADALGGRLQGQYRMRELGAMLAA